MKALLLHGPEDLRLEEISDPTPPSGWVRIRVEEVGICGTDKAFYKGTYKPGKIPLIPGHEIAGIIDEVGEGVDEGWIGHRVTTEINVACGKCWFCRNGMPTQCPYRSTIGISIDGGMAEYVIAPIENIHAIDDLTPEQGAFVEPLAAVLEMVSLEPPQPGARIAILGTGNMGLLSIQVLKYMAPGELVAVTRPGSPKAKIAREVGADHVLTVDEAFEFAKNNTPEGAGFDYVVETTGSPAGLDLALRLVRPRGVIAAKSTHGSSVPFNYTSLVVKEVRVVGSRCGPFPPAIKMLRKGLVKVEPLLTGKFPLESGAEAIKKSFERSQVKIHLIP